jgi:steroid delta-isomerase-like uncharacterized protein
MFLRVNLGVNHDSEVDMSSVFETAKSATTAYNDKNWNTVKTVFTENGIYDEKATGRRVQGVAKILEVWQGWAKAIPDSKATFVGEYAIGDTAIIEVVWKGTHTGPLQTATGTIPPSNKRIELPACQIIKVECGKVKSFTQYFDMATLLTQIGAFKS